MEKINETAVTRGTLLIASGAYVETELLSEFGKVPPSFLPVGNKRLLKYQVEWFTQHYRDIDLTVPEDFELDEIDARYLQQMRIRVCRTRAGISLGQAIYDYLDTWHRDGPLDILYGDTLIGDRNLGDTDWLAIGVSDEYYHWHHEAKTDESGAGVWAGMFSFSDSALLRKELVAERDFIAAVTAYGNSRGKLQRRQVSEWLDFGHVHTYYNSKRAITTQRHFNHLVIADGVVSKSSDDINKMRAEAAWLGEAPAAVRPFLPVFVEKREEAGTAGYSLEYLALPALNELYVFGRLPERVWRKILSACDAYFSAVCRVRPTEPLPSNFNAATYYSKTVDRLRTFSIQTGCDLNAAWTFNGIETPSLQIMAEEAAAAVMQSPPCASFIHGDLCFSNILFDYRSGRVKLIDPRGIDATGKITSFGDFRYEIGKLAHSVLGLYDFIVAEQYFLRFDGSAIEFRIPSERTLPLQNIFLKTRFRDRTPDEWNCYPVMLLLFLSMLPLHADDGRRQRALLANAMRIYLAWKEKKCSYDRANLPAAVRTCSTAHA